jgi:hypothetical protein
MTTGEIIVFFGSVYFGFTFSFLMGLLRQPFDS